MIERETKYKCPELVDTKLFMALLKAKFGGTVNEQYQLDEYFDTQDLYITNLRRGLRLRNKKILEFKSLFNNGKRYIIEEIQLDNDQLLEELLTTRLKLQKIKTGPNISLMNSFNLSPQQIIEKQRINLELEDMVLSLDKVKGLPVYIELEGTNEALRTELEKFLAVQTKIIPENHIGYVNLLYGKDPRFLTEKEFKKRFKNTPNWNVLDTETDLVKGLFKS